VIFRFDAWEYIVWTVWVKNLAAAGETVARPVKLAQASQTRLGEMNRELAQSCCAKGRPGDQLDFWASRQLAQARGVSPKRDPALSMLAFLCPRLGGGGTRLSETASPERDPSAWARCWARTCCVWLSVYS